jgi:hypothetical protein
MACERRAREDRKDGEALEEGARAAGAAAAAAAAATLVVAVPAGVQEADCAARRLLL